MYILHLPPLYFELDRESGCLIIFIKIFLHETTNRTTTSRCHLPVEEVFNWHNLADRDHLLLLGGVALQRVCHHVPIALLRTSLHSSDECESPISSTTSDPDVKLGPIPQHDRVRELNNWLSVHNWADA